MLKPRARLKKLSWELDFSTLDIKGRGAMGNLLTKYSVHRISMKEKGVSTLKGQKIWFDRDVLRLNTEGRGDLLGEFKADDKIFVLNKKGFYRTTGYDLSNRYSNDLLRIEKLNKDKILTVIYFDNDVNYYYIKRFQIEVSKREQWFVSKDDTAKLIAISCDKFPQVKIEFGGKHSYRPDEIVNAAEFISVKGYKAKGKRLTIFETSNIEFIEPLKVEDEDKSEENISENNIKIDEVSEMKTLF